MLIKLNEFNVKNLVLENSFKLRKSEAYKNIILSHDMSIEDITECRNLLVEKKKEITAKDDVNNWVVRVRGQPGEFHVVSYRRQNL